MLKYLLEWQVQDKLQISSVKQQNLIIDILKGRFDSIAESIINYIQSIDDLADLASLLQKAIAINRIDEFISD